MKRRAVTLLEVLFAILVVAIGIIGGVAVLSVAGRQAAKARTADAVTTSGSLAVADFAARGMNRPINWMAWNPATSSYQQYAPAFGESICIDPRFIAANSATPLAAASFPVNAANQRMRRITLASGVFSGVQPQPLGTLLADQLFVFRDDLSYDRPADQSLVAAQQYTSPTGTPTSRQFDGHLSWMATLCPKLERAAPIPTSEYVLSIIVFSDRPADLSPANEREVGIAFLGSGYMGGEVQLNGPTEESLYLHTNDWLMVSGVSQVSNGSLPFPVFQWYRVTDLDEPEKTAAGYTRYASLSGQDWDVARTTPRAVIVEEIAGVMERTIHVEP